MSGTSSLDDSRRMQDAALASLGLFRYKVPEDGNCMFRAVASQLQLDQDHYHKVLREAAAGWIQHHVGDLLAAGLLESVTEVQDTATEGKWCGQAALVALANVLKVNIAVVQGGDQGAIDIQHVAPFDGVTSKEHPGILLAYLYNGHYDAVVHEPNVSNPDYAVWSAKCHYNDAVSEKVAHKLSDATRTPPAVRALLHKDNSSGESKVSCMKIDLQPVKTSATDTSSVKVSSLRSYDRGRRPSVDNVQEVAVPQSPRHTVFRPSKSEVQAPSARRAQSESPDVRQRRSSSPGPTRQSPFTSIRAAVEKHRRRSNSRESPVDLPYNYDGSIRQFGLGNKPGSLTESRDNSPQKQYSKASLRKTASTGSNGHTVRSTTPVKNFGVDLKSSSRKIIRQSEQEEEYMPPRQLPPKQLSLNKDFGIDAEHTRHEVRRSSEGANLKKTSVPTAYQTSKPSFGVDFTSKKGKSSPAQKPKSLKSENGIRSSDRRDSTDSASKVPPKVPPKVLPKPSVKQAETKKVTVIPIRMSSSSSKTVDKEQQLPSQPVQNGYDSSQRTVKVRSISQQEVTKSVPQQPLNRASSSPGQRSSPSSKSRQQLSQEATERQYQRMRSQPREKQEQRTRTRSRPNGTSDHPPPQPRTRTRTREDKDGFEGYTKQRVRSRERRRSADSHHRKIAEAAHESSKQDYIETADIVTTPTEPLETKKKQYMPYVGLSPSQSRKVNVQVSTEDRDESTQVEPDPIILHSPQMVRDASTGSSSCTIPSGVGSLTSIPLSPISPAPYLGGLASSKPPHLSPGPYSPGPGVSVPSSPSPGISRIVQVAQNPNKEALEIPLRTNPEQPNSPRRRSVVEIHPQQVQIPATASTSTSKGIAKVPTIHLKSNVSDKKGKSNAMAQHKSQARMFFS